MSTLWSAPEPARVAAGAAGDPPAGASGDSSPVAPAPFSAAPSSRSALGHVGRVDAWRDRGFASAAEHRAHRKSDLHRHNLRRAASGRAEVTEEEFAEALARGGGDDVSSISGSDDDDSSDDDDDDDDVASASTTAAATTTATSNAASERRRGSAPRRWRGGRHPTAVRLISVVAAKLAGRPKLVEALRRNALASVPPTVPSPPGGEDALAAAAIAETPLTAKEDVDRLVAQATDPRALASMYEGWCPWL